MTEPQAMQSTEEPGPGSLRQDLSGEAPGGWSPLLNIGWRGVLAEVRNYNCQFSDNLKISQASSPPEESANLRTSLSLHPRI